MSTATPTREALEAEIKQEITDHKILVYAKGTKTSPRCGFTMGTVQFFNQLGYPFELIDALEQPEKRALLNELYDWQTLPKIFINGEFYGDLDIINEMIASGEFDAVLAKAFPEGKPSA
jgi:monothiol glutaredoxin